MGCPPATGELLFKWEQPIIRTFVKAVLAVATIYLGITLVVYLKQRDLMFAPSLDRVQPHDVGLADIVEVTLLTQEGLKLYSWYGAAKPEQPTILFFHGNSRGVSQREDKFRQLMAQGYGVFMLGYPGYGGSEGSPSESAFVNAAGLAYDWLSNAGIAPDDVVVYGESMGTAVAVQLAVVRQIKALILEAPMSSIREIAQNQYPFLAIGLLLKDPFMTIDYIDQVQVPLLIIHGTADAAIPIASGRKLFERANEPKTFLAIEGAGHNNLYDYPVVSAMHSFLNGRAEDLVIDRPGSNI